MSDGIFIVDVVEEDGELPAAEIVDGIQFGDHGVDVEGGIIDVEPGRNGKNKSDAVLIGGADQISQVIELIGRIMLTPFCAMIGIVFRGVNVSVEAVLFAETKKVDALSVRPRLTVKTFDDASDGNRLSGNKRRRKQCNDCSGDAQIFKQSKFLRA